MMIERFIAHKPTWLLIDMGWLATARAAPLLKYCSAIVVIGRLKWIDDSPHAGKEDCAWYRFDKSALPQPRLFVKGWDAHVR